jgi:tRNA pseudouridine55 synthase
MNDDEAIHGILVVDKPQGPTSHDIVAQARKIFRTRQIGHTGTLDPMATGVLVLLIGEATKLSTVLGADEKVYRARVQFGTSTDTDDALGTPTASVPVAAGLLCQARVQSALDIERARCEQLPPIYSAIKQSGQPLYKKARLGMPVVTEPRPVAVKALDLLDIGEDFVDLQLHCAKGYYVRALARDLGTALGCPAHLSSLRRIRAGALDIAGAVRWPPLTRPPVISLVEIAHLVLHCCELTDEGAARARQGKPLHMENFVPGKSPRGGLDGSMAWLFGQQLIAIGRWVDSEMLRVERGFNA